LTNYITLVSGFTANFGGTELLRPIEDILNVPLKDESTMRYVYVLTDGGISDTDQLITVVKNSPHLNKTVISTIGIGSGASSELVIKLAQAGGGM